MELKKVFEKIIYKKRVLLIILRIMDDYIKLGMKIYNLNEVIISFMNARKNRFFIEKIKNDKYAVVEKNKNLNKEIQIIIKNYSKKKDLNQIMIDCYL